MHRPGISEHARRRPCSRRRLGDPLSRSSHHATWCRQCWVSQGALPPPPPLKYKRGLEERAHWKRSRWLQRRGATGCGAPGRCSPATADWTAPASTAALPPARARRQKRSPSIAIIGSNQKTGLGRPAGPWTLAWCTDKILWRRKGPIQGAGAPWWVGGWAGGCPGSACVCRTAAPSHGPPPFAKARHLPDLRGRRSFAIRNVLTP